MQHVLLTALATAVFATAAIPAEAREPDRVKVRIPHADLDLTTQQGVDTMKRRITAETRKACTFSDSPDGDFAALDWRCYRTAKRSALSTLKKMQDQRLAMVAR